jgi:hypothetical protein
MEEILVLHRAVGRSGIAFLIYSPGTATGWFARAELPNIPDFAWGWA